MDPVKPQVKRGVLFYVGATGLLAVMVIEVIAVIGRHIRVPLLGALELAQAAIVPAACASMVIASLTNAHAAVHLVTERVPEHVRGAMARFSAILAGVFFLGIATGSGWLTIEFWNSFEETDVLHIPFRPLRVLVTVCAMALAFIFFHRGVSRGDRR
ncbi:MAG TPA: TRAP transporter small permease subunit [Steroidobacteraceae bacterium]